VSALKPRRKGSYIGLAGETVHAADQIYLLAEPGVMERAGLELARALSDSKGLAATSWHHQQLAWRYARRFGLAATLDRARVERGDEL
jgi:hypothetical protein